MLPRDYRGPFVNQRWLEIVNTEDRVIPPYACLEVVSDALYETDNPATPGGLPRIGVKRPSADNLVNVMFNGPFPIRGTSSTSTPFGFGTFDLPTWVLYDDADTPASGEQWGPQADSYEIKKGNTGLYVLGNSNATSGDGSAIVRVSGTTGGFSAGKSSSTITARSGTTPGEGQVVLYENIEGTLTAGATVNVLNIYTAIAGDLWVHVARDGQGNWHVISVECGA